jgi:hypothetical protein
VNRIEESANVKVGMRETCFLPSLSSSFSCCVLHVNEQAEGIPVTPSPVSLD